MQAHRERGCADPGQGGLTAGWVWGGAGELTAGRCRGRPRGFGNPSTWGEGRPAETSRSAGTGPGTALCNSSARSAKREEEGKRGSAAPLAACPPAGQRTEDRGQSTPGGRALVQSCRSRPPRGGSALGGGRELAQSPRWGRCSTLPGAPSPECECRSSPAHYAVITDTCGGRRRIDVGFRILPGGQHAFCLIRFQGPSLTVTVRPNTPWGRGKPVPPNNAVSGGDTWAGSDAESLRASCIRMRLVTRFSSSRRVATQPRPTHHR